MPQSEYKARQVRAKTHEVYEYDHDDEKPGKPLHILIPGGLIALVTLGLIIFIGYQTWFEENLTQNLGLTLIIIVAPFYVGGVFLFSYGYELYNIPRAIRLTAILVGAIVMLSAATAFVAARTIIQPLGALRQVAVRLGQGQLDAPVPIDRADEIGELAAAFASAGLPPLIAGVEPHEPA